MSLGLHPRIEAGRRLVSLICGRWRANLIRLRGGRLGTKVVIGRHCRIDRPYRLSAGDRVTIEDRSWVKIVSDAASVEIGDHTFLGYGVQLDVIEAVRIGSHTLIAPGCFVTDHHHGKRAGAKIDEQGYESSVVTIGSDVWLGAKVVVLPGVTIGDGAVVGAASVVVRNVEPHSVVAGSPAVPIGERT